MPLDTGSLAWEGRWEPELLPLPILRHPPIPRQLPSLPADPPAQSQRGQEQHHEDEEGVALVHGGPVLPGAEAGGRGAEVRRAGPHAAPPDNTVSQEGPLGRGGFPR